MFYIILFQFYSYFSPFDIVFKKKLDHIIKLDETPVFQHFVLLDGSGKLHGFEAHNSISRM